jgi:hypothetical protein
MKRFFSATLIIPFLMVSCTEKDLPAPSGQWSNSVFIINEGLYPTGSGTISAFNSETGEVIPDLFESANGRPLGNIAQSLTVHNNKAFIVVNNANKIEVVNLDDFKSVATIEDITYPRYFLAFNDNKGFVSCWDSTVKVIDLHDYTVISSMQTGTGPDEMLLAGDRLFVINSGGFGVDSTVSVFQTSNEEPLGKITVGHRPSGIRKDVNGKIWVLCSGKGWNGFPAPGDTPARLVCIDPDNLEIIKDISFPDPEIHPDNLVINKNGSILYYNHPEGIFAFPVAASMLSAQPLIISSIMYYGLGYEPGSEMIYASDPLDYAQNGWVFRFNASDGSLVDSFQAGIVPNGFWFNE